MNDPIHDDIIHEGRKIHVTWRGAEFVPPRSLVTQVSGLCFSEDGKVVLVTKDEVSWQLVGGHPEPGETIEQAFVREVAEETGAEVLEMHYLGTQQVNDPGNPDGKVVYYQVRFWAKVRLVGALGEKVNPISGQTPFQSNPKRNYVEDVIGWRCFTVEEVKAALAWKTMNVLDQLLDITVKKE